MATRKKLNLNTPEARRDYQREYYRKHREKAKEYQRQYNLTHKKKARLNKPNQKSFDMPREVMKTSYSYSNLLNLPTDKFIDVVDGILNGTRILTGN